MTVTTNYDELCEKALEAELGEPPARLLSEEGAVHLPRGRPRVVKLHGDFSYPDSLVLTGEDYLDWESKTEGLFNAVTAEFQHSSCVFVGYSLNDENLRRIISLVRRRLGDYAPKHYALVREVDDGTAAGFGDSVEFVEGDATKFLENLAARWLLEDPERVDLRVEERNLVEATERWDFTAAARSCERLQEEYERRGALNSAAAAWRYLAMEAEGAGEPIVALGAYTESGRLYRALGAEASAEEVFTEARRIARAEEMRAEEREVAELLQEMRLSGGDYEAALRETREVLDAAGSDAPSSLLYSLYAKRAAAKEALGDDDGAVVEIESALAAIHADALYLRTRLRADLARIRASLGEWEAAREALNRAETEIGGASGTLEGAESRRSKALVDLVRANVHYARGDNRDAIVLYEGCAEVLEELGEIGLFVSALRGAIACRRVIGDFATPQTRARAADAANAALEYRRIKDKESQGIAELAQEQFVVARAHLIQGLTETQSVHAPIRERSLRQWYAEVLRRAEAPVEALQQYVLAGDIKKTRELAAQLAVSPTIASTILQHLADGLAREASSGSVLRQAAAFSALGALADILPEAVLPDLTDLLSELGNSVSSMREHSYVVREAATMAASALPLLDRDQALRIAEA
ncbi:MAG: SIR2 family protein, partial [Rubrobacter sp.]|nr:SIR2 family protein [Rubrobacter sp.]